MTKFTLGRNIEKEEIELSSSNIAEEVVAAQTTPVEATTLREEDEDISKRTEFSKHYRRANGSFTAEYFNEPIHYFDKKTSKFEDIDVSLVEDKTGQFMETKSNKFKARFNKKVSSSNLITLDNDGAEISMKFLGRNSKRNGRRLNANSRMECETCGLGRRRKASSLRYKEVDTGIDLEYEVTANRLKENIIVNSLQDEYIFDFEMDIKGLKVAFGKDEKSLILYDGTEENVKFTIPSPVMYDSSGVYSDEVSYEIDLIEEGRLGFKLIASSEWINSTERKLPVTIDPEFIFITTSSGLNIEYYSTPDTRMYRNPNTFIGFDSESTEKKYFGLTITLPDMKTPNKIEEMMLFLNVKTDYNCETFSVGVTPCENFKPSRLYEIIGEQQPGFTVHKHKIGTLPPMQYGVDLTSIMADHDDTMLSIIFTPDGTSKGKIDFEQDISLIIDYTPFFGFTDRKYPDSTKINRKQIITEDGDVFYAHVIDADDGTGGTMLDAKTFNDFVVLQSPHEDICLPFNDLKTRVFNVGKSNPYAPTVDSGCVIHFSDGDGFNSQMFIANDIKQTTWRRSCQNYDWSPWTLMGGIQHNNYATSTVGGTIKIRLDNDGVLFITNDGSDA